MLEKVIKDIITLKGSIPFRDFMDLALYHPGLGYYTRPETDIGPAGDFFTASHLHPVFGRLIGRQVEELWRVMGTPAPFHLVEAGAGKGYLALDMLDYLSSTGCFDHLTYTIVEKNPAMKTKQEQLLSSFEGKIRWVHSFGEVDTFEGGVVSNELLDAFPVHLLEVREGQVQEVHVTLKGEGQGGEGFEEVYRPLSCELAAYAAEAGIPLREGYRTEANLAIGEWLEQVAAKLVRGFILTVDYGYPAWEYYSPQRSSGTLLCAHRHRANEDPYRNPGMQDITAHVNFTALKQWGRKYGFQAVGYAGQGVFLVSLGVDEELQAMADREDFTAEAAKVKRLILPQGMGESHKVMIQYKGGPCPVLRGFSIRNQLDRLDWQGE